MPAIRHIVGLAVFLAMLALSYLFWGEITGWLRGTFLSDMPVLAFVFAFIVVFWVLEWLGGKLAALMPDGADH